MPLVTHSCVLACGKGSGACDSSVAEQPFQRLDTGTPRATRANCRSEERAASHPLPTPCGRWRQSSALRLRRATRPTSRRAASGLGRESHDEPKVQRTQSMTGKSCNPNKIDRRGLWWTARVGVPSFGTVHLPRIDPCDGVQRSAGSYFTAKERRRSTVFPATSAFRKPASVLETQSE
jgi:hypothetical protein